MTAVSSFILSGDLIAQESNQDDGVALDEITVSGSKRDLTIGSFSSGVSIVDGQQLDDARVSETANLEDLVPSLKVNMRGSRAFTNFTIRGLGSADFYNSAIAVYVDGVPQDVAALDQALFDAERVEVLKGSQGTLYGRNAFAGVINITTRPPDNEVRAEAQATAATLKSDAQALFSGPVIEDTLFASAVAGVANDRGESDNVLTGEDNADGSDNQYFRGKVRYAPKDSPIDATLSYSRDHLDSEELFFDEAGADDRESDVGFTDDITRDVQTGALNVVGDFGDLSLVSTTSTQLVDLDRTIVLPEDEEQKSYSQELRGIYDPAGKPFSGLVGVFAQAAQFERDATSFITLNTYDADVDTESYAVFGEGTYDITDALSATLGLRYAYDRAELDFEEVDGLSFEEDDGWSALLPKVGLSYRASESLSLYATASQGYKPGGFNRTATSSAAEIPYDTETSTTVEAGVRADIFGGKLPLQAAAYYTEVDDIQLFTGELGEQVIRNLGDARSYGVEAEASAFLTDSFEISGGAQINEAEFKGDAEVNGIDIGGNTLPFAPRYTLTLAAQYYWEPASVDGTVIPRAAINYYGETFFEETNTFKEEGFSTIDLSVSYEETKFSFTVFVDNVLDENYKTYQVSENTIQLGDGLNAGIRFNVPF